jgi:quinol monooxygenase YgiN
MNTFCGVAAVMAMVAIAMGTSAQAQDANAVHVVTYVEVKPSAKSEAAAALRTLRETSRKDDGNLRTEVLESVSRPGQFVILATWKDQKALDAHMAAAATKEARDKLNGVRNSPADDRIHNSLAVATSDAGRRSARAVYVVTHVDVPPPRKDECVTMLKTLADDSRKDQGNVAFDVVQQTSRPNHFTVMEAWKDRKAYDAHVAAAHTRAFRDQLTPMSGALYDERLYRAVK